LATSFQTIKFEDLKLSNMTRSSKGTVQNPGKNVAAKSGLNREMLRLGLSTLVLRTEQKSMTNGGQVVYINPKFTSQTCSCCGVIDKKSRISQSKFVCVHCGYTLNADINAALNILRA
jgi:putative transposase